MNRRRVVAGVWTLFCAASLLAGCGGGGKKKEATTDTGSSSGSLATVQITPEPGSVYIGRSTTFRLAWTSDYPPPPSFTAALVRYHENSGNSSTDTQKTDLNREGDSYVWNLKRSDNFDLEAPAVYFVELTAGSEQQRFVYIVSSDRSVPVASFTRAVVDSTKYAAADTPPAPSGSARVHGVTVGAAR